MSKDKLCFHCNTTIPSGTNYVWNRGDENLEYCCQGCKTVSQIILDSGNTRFYDIRGSQIIPPIQSPEEDRSIREEYLNGELVREEYIREVEPNLWESHITITNIHCSACVWLNEKVLQDEAGIKYARINFATGRALVHFDPNIIQLSNIFALIESIGYLPRLHSPWKSNPSIQSNKDLLIRMGVAGFCFGNIMLFGTSLYAGYFQGMEMEIKRLLHYLSWIFATPAYFYSGYPFLRGAWQGLKIKRLSMDFLLVSGISLAYFYSIYVTISDNGEVYFDTVCMIYFFILLGKYLEDSARIRSSDKVSQLVAGLPEIATTLDDEGNEKILRSSEIKKDTLVLIRSGERVPVDGWIQNEIAYLDESFLTGESKPITKQKYDKALAGSIVSSKPIQIIAETDSKNSTLSRLKVLIEQAMGEKPSLERITDRISGYFITIVFLLATGTFISWFFFLGSGLENSLINTIAVLIVACPCALGLAVPTALVMNHIRNSREGVIIKNPDSIETLSKLDIVFLDKTGTLTEGKLKIVTQSFIDLDLASILTYSMEKFSTHPIAKNLVLELERSYSNLRTIPTQSRSVEEISGSGMTGEIYYNNQWHSCKIGSPKFLNITEKSELTRIHLEINGVYAGYWELSDNLRTGTKDAVSLLHTQVPEIVLLSGDAKNVVARVARELGIQNYFSEIKPDEKLSVVSTAQERGKIVSMIGDGINDSAALAKSDIGVSMGIASDLSLDKSDIILVQNDLRSFSKAILYAKSTTRIIRQNITISFLYNSVMLPLAAMGFMAPVICAVFMTLSSLTVVGNSLRLRSK